MHTARPWKKARTTSATDTSFASKVATVTEPSADGVHDLRADGGVLVPCTLIIIPYGLGDDNDVFDMRVIGWKHIGSGWGAATTLWVPCPLAQFTCTLSAAVGVASAPVIATERFADTITISSAIAPKTTDTDSGGAASSGEVLITSPTSDLIAHIRMHVEGFEKLEFTFDMTTGDPTNGNALISFLP